MSILAHLHVDGDTEPGLYRFASIPRRGDRIHIEQDDDILILTVERVDHYPVAAKLGAANIFGSITPAVTVYCGRVG